MTDQLEPVDWSGIKIAPAGPRHYEGSEAQAKPIWKCPACGEENQGLLEAGCTACGSGGGAKHVGVPPAVRKDQISTVRTSTVRTVPTTPIEPFNHLCLRRFLLWLDTLRPRPTASEQARLFPAFIAGWHARPQTWENEMTTDEEEMVAPYDDPAPTAGDLPAELEGTIQSRTLVAALTFFADQVLRQQPEETETGEWLKADQINQLIEDVKGRYV